MKKDISILNINDIELIKNLNDNLTEDIISNIENLIEKILDYISYSYTNENLCRDVTECIILDNPFSNINIVSDNIYNNVEEIILKCVDKVNLIIDKVRTSNCNIKMLHAISYLEIDEFDELNLIKRIEIAEVLIETLNKDIYLIERKGLKWLKEIIYNIIITQRFSK
ncbi:hypothetical protein [Clostridium sp. UBA5988]|uniref:hypothetical protein n=1 Tax=Clostridium sp. UBA5988 TaxID=1946369 RepID=UPI00321765F1